MLHTLREAGLPVTEVLGAGMEGTVAALDDDRVVKLWDRRSRADLEGLRTFYDAVHQAGIKLRVPRILAIVAVGDGWATVQARLTGTPLWTDHDVSPTRGGRHARALLEVVTALVTLRPTAEMAVLPLAAGAPPFDPAVPFGESLATLVEARVERDAATLARLLPDIESRGAALAIALRSLPPAEAALVHGDLGPSNILAVEGRPTSLLDFGYLSTVGDPAFDAAVAATLFDMFGSHAAEAEEWVDRLFADRFGYARDRIVLYRAAYGLVTASCLVAVADGRHFRWCADLVGRPETTATLGL